MMLFGERRANAEPSALARSPPVSDQIVTVDEWDQMFTAVRERLTRNVGLLLALAVGNDAGQTRTDLLECVEALGQLQVLLVPERDRSVRLELEIFDLRNALALAVPELFQVPARPHLKFPTRDMNGR
ncbi:MAG: hypothetical protein ABI460_12940 [Caldimonas sp.]